MKCADFNYHRATSVEDAVRCLDSYGGAARILAGGQSLMPMLNMRLLRPAAVVDINGIPNLATISGHGDETIIGAMARHATLEISEVLCSRLPLLARMVRSIGDRQVRNRGTLGGSLVQGDPTGEMPLGCLVLRARVRVIGPGGTRDIAMDAFYDGSYAAALESNEIVTEVAFPKHPQHFAFHELCRRHNDFAVLSIAVAGNCSTSGHWTDIRLGLGGVHDTPILVPEAADILEGSLFMEEDIAAAAAAALRAVSPPSDMRATEQYRRHLVSVHVRRALTEMSEKGQ